MKEEKVTDFKIVDSSIWIAYAIDGECKNIIDSHDSFSISVLSLFELKKRLLKDGLPDIEVANVLSLVKKRVSFILDVSESLAELAAEISVKHNLPAIDSIIYATALGNNAELLTLDNDFRGLSNAVVFEKHKR